MNTIRRLRADAAPMRTLRGYLVLMRVVPSVAAAVEVPLGAYLATGSTTSFGSLMVLRGMIAILLVTATVNVVNDITDVQADAVNKSGRPLPSGQVSVRAAAVFAALCGAAALVLGMLNGPGSGLGIAILLVLGTAYSLLLKSTVLWGNVLVATLAASPLPYGASLTGHVPAAAVIGAVVLCSFMLCFEVLKTLRDEVADRHAGYNTLATCCGPSITIATFRMVVLVFTALALVITPVVLTSTGWLYLFLVGAGAVLPTLAVAWLLPIRHSPVAIRTALRVMTAAWLPGLLALAALA
jgi:geranylgeranylglycerol-phosphate geranylgeranyltransferase